MDNHSRPQMEVGYCGHRPLAPLVDDIVALIDAALADEPQPRQTVDSEQE